MADSRRFLRDNAVLVAAFVLPALVALLFILATAIPKWTVPLPQYDLVLQVQNYDGSPAAQSVEFSLRDGRVEATVRTILKPEKPDAIVPYPPRWKLLLFEHASMRVREIAVEIPRDIPPGESRTVVVEALANRRVTPGDVAPDGYKVTSLNTGTTGGGIVNDLFGMNHRYHRGIAIGRNGRTVELELPTPYSEYYGAIRTIGWIAER